MSKRPITFAVIGIDHRHIYGMIEYMRATGAVCKGWWTEGEPTTLRGFLKRFPDLPRVADRRVFLNDPAIDLIQISAIPADRAALAIEAMEHGKDVMVDKPGCTTLAQLEILREVIRRTGRIWSVNYSERFEVPAAVKATELVAAGAIGKVVQTIGLGPHRLNRALRPKWFFELDRYGGILCDIGSHQIDQFMFFTGSATAEIVASSVGNFANPGDRGLQDFGEILLRSPHAQGYTRLDWYTPDALDTWGDCRATILGTEGYIELRKYIDIAGRPGADHLFLVNKTRCEYIDCSKVPLTYFERIADDIRDRTETVMTQDYCNYVTELALTAQRDARIVGNFA